MSEYPSVCGLCKFAKKTNYVKSPAVRYRFPVGHRYGMIKIPMLVQVKNIRAAGLHFRHGVVVYTVVVADNRQPACMNPDT